VIYVLVFLHFISTDRLQYYQIGTYSDKQECLDQAEKAKNNGDPQLNEGDLPRSERPTIIERGKKFAAYDKSGKLLILGYERRIVQEYAYAQSKLRLER
jgi:hypothetical protein